MSHWKRCLVAPVAAALAVLVLLPAGGASARDLFTPPGLGMTPPNVPRATPPVKAPSFTANQCELLAGTCPLGRLQRSGTRCYCASADGGVRQGGARKREGVTPQIQPIPMPRPPPVPAR